MTFLAYVIVIGHSFNKRINWLLIGSNHITLCLNSNSHVTHDGLWILSLKSGNFSHSLPGDLRPLKSPQTLPSPFTDLFAQVKQFRNLKFRIRRQYVLGSSKGRAASRFVLLSEKL